MTGDKSNSSAANHSAGVPTTPGNTGGMAGFGSNYDQPIFPSVSSAFKRRRGRPRKEEQLQREELTERLIHFLETHYENYRNCSRLEFYNAAAEYLGDVEPGEVRLIFDKLIDAYVESRRRRMHPGRDRHITQWFGRLDSLLHTSTGSVLGGAGNSGASSTNGGEEGEARPGRKRVSTVLEAFIGRGGASNDEDAEFYEEDVPNSPYDEQDSAVHKAILRTHLATLQTQQQIQELLRQQLELQQEMFAYIRTIGGDKFSENLQDLKLELGLEGQNH
jgi:hypothetical protein